MCLKDIKLILERIDEMNKRLIALETENKIMKIIHKEKTTLTKSNQVQEFLNISKNTLNSLVAKKRLIKGIHYNNTDTGRRFYIADAIIEFEKTYIKYEKPMNKSINEDDEILKRLIS